MISILEKVRTASYREGWQQGVMIAECDCPECPPAPRRLTWWLIGTISGALFSWWLA